MTTNYKTKNAAAVLSKVERMIADIENGMTRRYYINDVCNELSIFDWWNDWMSKSQLKDMRKFLKEAIKLGYDGYVCFKVGASGCSNGMWAYKAESTDGYSPKNSEFLYKSFTPSYNYWSAMTADCEDIRDADGNGEFKTIKELEAVLDEYEQSKVEVENETEAESNAEITETEQAVEVETEAAAVESKDITVKVNKDRYNALRWAVAYALKDMDVDLYENGTVFGSGVLRWDVNWSALGDKTPAEAEFFAECLKMAADMAEALNDMNMEMVWENDEALNSLITEDREEASRRLMNFKMMIVDQLTEITALDPVSYDRLYELMTDYTI